MRTLTQDFRYALRGIARNPGFTAVAVLTLALGIGANTAIFSILNAMMLRPMPGVADPARLLWITHIENGRAARVSYPDAVDYRKHADVFAGVAAVDNVPVHVATPDATERLEAQIAGGDYFRVLGLVPAAGMFFTTEDDRARRTVVVISAGLWRRRFGADPRAVGRSVTVNGRPFTILGVAPAGFAGLDLDSPPDVFLPLETWLSGTDRARSLGSRASARFRVLARLAPGTSPAQAEAAVKATAVANASLRPADLRNTTASVETPRGWVPPGHMYEILPMAGLALAATGLVLLIASANVANLLLGRAARRRREMGIRVAIGASRGRILRQLLTESVLLAGLGAAAGLLLSSWALDLLLSRFDVPPLLQPVVDGRLLAYGAVVALATGILFGLAPAWSAARPDVLAALKGDSSGSGRPGQRLQGSLVVVQVALSLVLLAAGGLLLRSLAKAAAVPAGFDRASAGEVVTLSFDPVTQGYPEARAQQFREAMLERARSLPGVRAVALAELLPLSNRAVADDFAPEDRPAEVPQQVFFTTVSPGYFETLGIPLVGGRDFTPEDRAGGPAVAIVNETLARRFWPGQSPLGRRFATADRPGEGFEVVGVARDGKYLSLTEPARPFAYFALAQGAHLNENILLVRGSRGEALSDAVRAAARSLDPTMPLFQAETLEEALRRTTAGRRQGTLLLAGFGALALLLAAVGLYGVVAFAVGQRRREIGIRMALGAARRDIVSLFVGRGARLAGLGVAIGLVLASGITRLLSSMLFGVTPLDVTTLAAVSALLAAVALAASALPARRAARIDPASVLRND